MSRGPCSFKETDLTRAIRATEKAGKSVRRVKIKPDCIVLDTSTTEETDEAAEPRVNFFDQKLGLNK